MGKKFQQHSWRRHKRLMSHRKDGRREGAVNRHFEGFVYACVCPAPNIFIPTDLSSIQAGNPQLPTKNQNSCHRSSRRKLFLIMIYGRYFENLKISSVSRSL